AILSAGSAILSAGSAILSAGSTIWSAGSAIWRKFLTNWVAFTHQSSVKYKGSSLISKKWNLFTAYISRKFLKLSGEQQTKTTTCKKSTIASGYVLGVAQLSVL
ncbi:hypothetical protein QA601_15100, partial [Chitinispirillales bacterium ANBcel5]|uniref:hypothetical protein n=1 Tax=Cellulosispirillum alkaliphilum TaxID=3039283 RepID=UPI002A5902D0|nr:hypothetical protein [Chitinispirillales bacterium ANBcel5]